MKKVLLIYTMICMFVIMVLCSTLSVAVAAAYNDIDFDSAEPIECDVIYKKTVENNSYILSSFTAPEDGYYLFEAIGDKYKVGEFFEKKYNYYEPVAALYDSDKNELQYVEFDFYEPSIKGQVPYTKMVQKLKKGEVCYCKTQLLDPESSGKYSIRVMKAPDLVFTYSSADEFSGNYEIYRYTGSSKEFTLNSSYTVGKDDSLFTPMDDVVLDGIGLNAFEGNEYLESITFPYDLKYIASEAFLNCKMLNTVNLSRNLGIIGYRAFAGCESLKSITINSYDVVLEPQCLGYDENGNKYSDFKIFCNEDSTAEEYAKQNGIDYTLITKEPKPTDSSDKTNTSNSSNNKKDQPASEKPNISTSASVSSAPSKVIKVVKPKVKQAKIKKVTKTSKKKRLKVKWKKISGVSGYEIKCGLNRKMNKGKRDITIKKNSNSKIIKSLKSKKIYYIKVRAYKTYKSESGEIRKSYGKWSKIIRAKTR